MKTTARDKAQGNGRAAVGAVTPRQLVRHSDGLRSDWSDSIEAQVDSRIEERFDGESTRSNLAILLSGFAVLMAAIAGVTIFIVAGDDSSDQSRAAAVVGGGSGVAGATPAVAITPDAGKGAPFEHYQRPDPTLPSVPAGDVKRFRVDVFEHVTKVSDEFAPTRVWSFGVNGTFYRGTGVSTPIVVNQGDNVEITLVNGGSKAMDVTMPHSIDFHSAEVNPTEAYATIQPGQTHKFSFTANHPGVFMYHCATDPVLMHTGAGMVGMMVVKPGNLPPVDKELWVTQQEYYLGPPGKDADILKMEAKQPDVIAFNGYANQYKEHPIVVKRGERIRMYVLNAGPSEWTAFHVIGTVFDTTDVEGVVGHDSQTVSLAPSQGGWVDFTLDKDGTYPFVDHSFGDMVKGAAGALATQNAPPPTAGASH